MTKKTSPAYRASKEETIPINKLHPFSNHPFHIRHDLEFSELVDSISESGIITPIIVRPKVGVGYEVISGHRRWEACKELGIESIPARVEYIDDDEATILMVNSNIQREHVLPSEKAFAYGKAAPTTTPASCLPTIPAWESDAGFAARKQDSIPIGQ